MLRAFQTAAPMLLCAAALTAQEIRPTFTPVGDVQPGSLWEAVESPDGRNVLAVVEDWTSYGLMRFDRTTGQWTRHPDIGARINLTIAPNGRFLAYQRQGQDGARYVWMTPIDSATSLPSGPSRRVTTRPGAAPAFSPDGRTIAFRWTDSATSWLYTMPFSGGEERVVLEVPGRIGPPHWSRDGRYLYAGYARPPRPTFVLRVPASGGPTDTITGPFPAGEAAISDARAFIGLSADGQRILERPSGSRYAVVSDTGGRELGRFAIPRDLAISGWSAVNPRRVLAIQRRTPTTLQAVSVDSATVRPLTTGRRFDRHPVFSPDGSLLAFATLIGSRYHIVISAPDGTGRRVIAGDADADGRIAWSPDGHWIAFASHNPALLSVVDVRAAQQRTLVIVDSVRAWTGAFAWRGDSRGIAYVRESSAPGRGFEARLALLSGSDVLWRALPEASLPPRGRSFVFIGPSLLAVVRPESIVGIPLPAGPGRTLYRGPILNADLGISKDLQWIGAVTFESGGASNGIPVTVSVATGEVRAPSDRFGLVIDFVRFHTDGRHLVVFGRGPDNRSQVALVSLTGGPPRILTASDRSRQDYGTLTISPDGRTIVYDDLQAVESQLIDIDLPTNLARTAP